MMPVRRASTTAALLLALVAALPASAQTSGPALSPKEAKRKEAVEHYLRARLFAQDTEFEEAVKEFRKAVDLDPEDGALRREYGELLRDIPIYPEAEREARKAVELAPESAGAHRLLGQVLLATAKDKPRLEEAAAELGKAAQIGPPDPQGAVALAQASLRLERPKDAVAALESVADRAHGPSFLLLYGEALERDGQTAKAEEVYKSLLRQDPEDRAASLGLLRVYDRSHQFDKEAALLESYMKNQPGNLAARTQYATALLRGRRFAESRKAFEQVLAADPGNRDALRMYAALLSETLETDKADEILKKLQALDPDDPEVAYRRAMNFLEARRLPEAERVLAGPQEIPRRQEGGRARSRADRRPARVHRVPEEGLRRCDVAPEAAPLGRRRSQFPGLQPPRADRARPGGLGGRPAPDARGLREGRKEDAERPGDARGVPAALGRRPRTRQRARRS